MEMSRHAQLMYTSCGWFFDELSGIETVQCMQYAARVAELIAANPRPAAGRGFSLMSWLRGRPIRRSLAVAVAVLLVVAAVAGAVGLGVPGIRILFGGPTPSPSGPASPSPSKTPPASLGTLGQSLGLGAKVSLDEAERLNRRIVARALAMDGTCTGEHGVGMHKIDFLREEHGDDALELMARIKRSFDPQNILNPGKVVHV